MRIAFLAHAGSVHTRRWSLGLKSRGHELRILTQSDMQGIPSEFPVDLLPGQGSIAYFRNIPRVRNILADFKPEIVHAHYATGYGLWGYMQKTAPLIVTVWGTDIADALKDKIFIAPIVRRALKKARFITAASKFLLNQTAMFEPSVREKLVHIPFGIRVGSDEAPLEKKNDEVRVIFAKQFYPVYEPEMVVRAFAEVAERMKNIKLLMIGGGPLQKKLERLVSDLELSSKIEIKGWVEMAAADRMIAESDIMVMPSRMESFGVAALQAAAAGVPVVATKVGGIPEIVEDNVTGLLINPGDEKALVEAIIRLTEDSALRREMGQAGRDKARRLYDFENCLDKMEELYRKAVAG